MIDFYLFIYLFAIIGDKLNIFGLWTVGVEKTSIMAALLQENFTNS